MRKVFISSTYWDLVEHRQMVIKQIRRLGKHVICMEDFGSRPKEPIAVCTEEVNKCHAFVGIYAHRYGFVPPRGERSITEQEYALARELDKPCFCYLVNPLWPWTPGFIEDEPGKSKLAAFKQKVNSEVVRSEFTTPDNLALQVGADLARWQLETGTPDERRCLVPITVADLARNNKRLQQLKELHHRLQEITLDLDALQSYVRLVQQAGPPAGIEYLSDFWKRQCSPKLGNLGVLFEETEDDIRRRVEEIIQWQLTLEDALKDKYSTVDSIYDLVSDFQSICTRHLLWADSELHEAASRSCELSDRLMILTVEVTHDNQK
jgi:hypothetical protein